MNAPHKIATEIVEASGWPHGSARVADRLLNQVEPQDDAWHKSEAVVRLLDALIDATTLAYRLTTMGQSSAADMLGTVDHTYAFSQWNRGKVKMFAPSHGCCVVSELWEALEEARNDAIDTQLVLEGLKPSNDEHFNHCDESADRFMRLREDWASVEDAFSARVEARGA